MVNLSRSREGPLQGAGGYFADGRRESHMTQQLYMNYWKKFCDTLKERGSLVCFDKPRDEYWLPYGLGSGVRLSPVASKGKRYISMEVIFEGDAAKERFASLKEQRREIDKELGKPPLGETLCWRDEPSNQQCDIKLRRDDCDISNPTQWDEQHNWLYAKLQLFYAVFAHRVKRL